MARFTAGDLNKLYYVDETVYGTTPTDALSWGGEIVTLTPTTDMKNSYHAISGDRSFGAHTRDASDIGFNVKAWARTAAAPYDWADFWAYYGLGSTSGLATHLDSFTAQISKTSGGTTHYDFYNGCKVNSFGITAEAVGAPLVFEHDVIAQWWTPKTSKTLTGLQSLTVGANPSDQTGDILTWDNKSQINLGGGGLSDWYPSRWQLTVAQNISRHYGHVTGADSNTYNCAVKLDEGIRDVTLTVTVPYEDETYTAAKLGDTAITAVTLPVGAKTITLSSGVIEPNNIPELKHEFMDETISIKFPKSSISIS